MLRIPVSIEIKSLQQEGCENNLTESFSEGTMTEQDDRIYISYKEEIEGAGSVPSLLTLQENGMTILRKGEMRTDMHFVPGQLTHAEYSTSAGNITLDIRTDACKMSYNRKDTEIVAEADYALYAGEEEISKNHIRIEIRKRDD